MEAANQNQKFPFHFWSAPPTPPAENLKKGRKIFGFVPRPKGADEARIIRRWDYQQNTFELRPIHTAKIENRNWKPKWGRAAGATQTHSHQKFPNPKGFSTLRVALSFANTL